jgi:hypothetical protein
MLTFLLMTLNSCLQFHKERWMEILTLIKTEATKIRNYEKVIFFTYSGLSSGFLLVY